MEENKKDSLNIHLTIHRKVVIGKELEFLLDTIKQEAQKNIDEKQFVQAEKEPHIQQINSTKEHNKDSRLKIIFILACLIFLVALIALVIDESQKKKLTSDPILMLLKSSDTTEAKFLNMSDRERQKGYKELTMYFYFYKDGKIDESTKSLNTHYTYDEEGNISTETTYRKGNESSKFVYGYNQKHMLTQTVFYSDLENYQENIKYYKGDTIIAELIKKWFEGGEIKSIRETKYDDKGNKISNRFYKYNNKNNWQYKSNTKNIYNKENQLIKTITIGYEKEFEDNEINAKVDTIIKTYDDIYGTQIQTGEKPKYNSQGQIYKRNFLDGFDKITYNKRGLRLSITYYKNYKPEYIWIYDYQ